MKERIEDLGRLREKISVLWDDELFHLFEREGITRPKDAIDGFNALTEERKEDLINDIAYGIARVLDELCACYFIADGEDE